MTEFSVLHCADLHLNSPFIGLSKIDAEVAQELRAATFSSFRRIVDHAIENRVQLVTVAGDVYDSADHGLYTAIRFRDELRRLSKAKIPCCIVAGNHDPLANRRLVANLPMGCHLFGEKVGCLPVDHDGEVTAHVYGVSYPQIAVRKNLAKQLVGAFREEPGLHLALLHCNVQGCTGHDDYAPCTLDELRQAPFDAWLLGHVHERRVLSDAHPLVIYPGNTQGRSIRELDARGASLIRFGENGEPEVEFVPTSEVAWHCGETSIEGLLELEELVERVDEDLENLAASNPEQRASVVRWSLIGRGVLHRQLAEGLDELVETLRDRLKQNTLPVWIERLVDATQPALDLVELRQQQGFISMVLGCGEDLADKLVSDDAIQQRFAALWSSQGLSGPLREMRKRLEEDSSFAREVVERATLRAVNSLIDEGGN